MTLDELEALERAATLRPWRTKFDAACGHVVTADQEWVCIVGDEEGARELAAFVATARNALPALLRVARAAQTYCVAVRPAPLAGEDCTDELVALDAALAALEAIQ